jgi:transcriptional regulator GlxA family with amidase domain
MESGIPIIERIYGFVADRSDSLNCVTVRPVTGIDGKRIGTATIYWRAQQKMRSSSWYDPIRKAVVYLNDHLSEDVSIERLAAIANYSPAQFRRLFTRLMGQSPSAYIANIRINNAKVLLKTTDKRISDIAVEVGFFDHSHFIRTFRKLVGATPAEYRKSL